MEKGCSYIVCVREEMELLSAGARSSITCWLEQGERSMRRFQQLEEIGWSVIFVVVRRWRCFGHGWEERGVVVGWSEWEGDESVMRESQGEIFRLPCDSLACREEEGVSAAAERKECLCLA